MQVDVLRTKQINLKLTSDELERLEALATHYAISPQSVLRMLLKKGFDDVNEILKNAARGQPGVSSSLPTKATKAKSKR